MVQSTGRPHVVEGLRLVALVGRGGEGEVWEARDRRGRRRALKLVRPDCLAPPREAVVRGRLLVRIDHPALVRVHRSGLLSGWSDDPGAGGEAERELEGWGFVEMDFIDGPSLATAAADPDVLERLAPLAEALDLLHAGHWSDGVPMVHRDVKPANIVEDTDGRLILVDPSTLRGVDDGQLTRIGTPLFCAPEVMLGDVTPAADVYSFAATIVALATGRRGSALAEILRDPGEFDLPPGVRQALSSHPSQRPLSCRAVLRQGLVADPLPELPTWGDAWRDGTGDLAAGPAAPDDGWGPPDTGHPRAAPGARPRARGAHAAGGTGTAGPGTWEDVAAPGAGGDLAATGVRGDGAATGVRGDGAAPGSGGTWEDGPAPGGGGDHAAGGAWDAGGRGDRAEPAGPGGAGRAVRAWPPPAEPDGPAPAARGPAALPWVGLATLLAFAPLVARFLGVGPDAFALAALGTVAGHVGAVAVAGAPVLLAVVPPLAWAVVVGDRLGATRRRRLWARALLLPAFAALSVVPAAVLVPRLLPPPYAAAAEGAMPPRDVALLGVLGLASALLGVAAARARDLPGVLLRLLTLPVWLVGAAAIVVGGLALAVPAVLVGRAPALVRTAALTVAGLVEVALPPRPDTSPTGDDPRALVIPRAG